MPKKSIPNTNADTNSCATKGSITMTIAQNLHDNLTLTEIENLAIQLGVAIQHNQEERVIMKCKLTLQVAERLLQDPTGTYAR